MLECAAAKLKICHKMSTAAEQKKTESILGYVVSRKDNRKFCDFFFAQRINQKLWSLPITRENKRNCNGDCPWMTCICFGFVCCITQRSKLLSKVILVNFKPFAKHSTLSKDTTIKGQRFKVGHWPFATR